MQNKFCVEAEEAVPACKGKSFFLRAYPADSACPASAPCPLNGKRTAGSLSFSLVEMLKSRYKSALSSKCVVKHTGYIRVFLHLSLILHPIIWIQSLEIFDTEQGLLDEYPEINTKK